MLMQDFFLFLNVLGVSYKRSIFYKTLLKQKQLDLDEFIKDFEFFSKQKDLSKYKTFIKKFKTMNNFKDFLNQKNIFFTTYGSNYYPREFLSLYNPPLVVFSNKDFKDFPINKFSIIGTRKPSLYSKKATSNFVKQFYEYEFATVSGFMYGIDIEVFLKSVQLNMPTVAVLGYGFGFSYPKDFLKIRQAYKQEAFFITEFSYDFAPTKYSFVLRNRLIASLGLGLLVIEAGLKSGSLTTVEYAIEQGKTVFTIPHPLDSLNIKGSISMINNGAFVVANVDDIFYYLDICIQKKVNKQDTQVSKKNLSDIQYAILEILQTKGLESAENIAKQLNIDFDKCMVELNKMYYDKILQFDGQNWVISKKE